MKKVLLLVLCCMCFCGCGEKKDEKNEGNQNVSVEQINEKLMDTNNWLTNIWNDGICDISHYLNDGTNSIGQTMDIDFTLQNLNELYKDKDKHMDFINSLDDNNYSLIKTSFSKAIEQSNIIIEKTKQNKPMPNTETDYQQNIELFNQYQNAFYEKVNELYYEQ